MKKTISLLALLIVFAFACEHSDVQPLPQAEVTLLKNATIQNGILTFNSIDDYKSFLHQSSEEEKTAFIASLQRIKKYTSLKDQYLNTRLSSSGRGMTTE